MHRFDPNNNGAEITVLERKVESAVTDRRYIAPKMYISIILIGIGAFLENKGIKMDRTNFFDDLQSKINQALENSPAKDIEKNVKAMLTQGFSKLDLVTREEFDIQTQVLAKTRAKLDALEARVTELEAQLKKAQ